MKGVKLTTRPRSLPRPHKRLKIEIKPQPPGLVKDGLGPQEIERMDIRELEEQVRRLLWWIRYLATEAEEGGGRR
jgi:hypothetical protein